MYILILEMEHVPYIRVWLVDRYVVVILFSCCALLLVLMSGAAALVFHWVVVAWQCIPINNETTVYTVNTNVMK